VPCRSFEALRPGRGADPRYPLGPPLMLSPVALPRTSSVDGISGTPSSWQTPRDERNHSRRRPAGEALYPRFRRPPGRCCPPSRRLFHRLSTVVERTQRARSRPPRIHRACGRHKSVPRNRRQRNGLLDVISDRSSGRPPLGTSRSYRAPPGGGSGFLHRIGRPESRLSTRFGSSPHLPTIVG